MQVPGPEPGPADRRTLEFLAEHRVATPPQLARWLGVTPATAVRRARLLAASGWAAVDPIFKGLPPALTITAAGLRAIASPLPTPRVDLQCYRHDIGVGWLWLAAHTGAFGELTGVVSERRMRSADARLGRRTADPGQLRPHGVGIGGVGANGLPQLHYPDLLLRPAAGGTLAVELELSSKGARRLAGIIRGYAGDQRISGVLYLVSGRRIGEQIASAAARAAVTDLVHVQPLARGDSIAGAPPLRTRARARPNTARSAPRSHGNRSPAQAPAVGA